MSFTYVDKDSNREPPTEWTDADIGRLFDHARDLGQHGNPAGYMLTVSWRQWVSDPDEQGESLLRLRKDWDYPEIRAWITSHSNHVRVVWQYIVRSVS